MSDTVELPWIDEPVELAEAVELIAQADEDDEDAIQETVDRIEQLERRVSGLVDGSSVECPSCEQDEPVYKAGVGAALLANDGDLTESNADVINRNSHVCIDCREAFTPPVD